jgi:hypothetical protein
VDGRGIEHRTPGPRRAKPACRSSLAGAANAAPDLVLGLMYVTALVDRSLLPEGTVTALARVIPIEFAVIHASGFLAWPWLAREWTRKRRALFVVGLAGFYTLGLGVFALIQGALWPLAIFWGLMLNRMLVVLLGDLPDDAAFREWSFAWAGTTALYMLGVCVGVLGAQTDRTRGLLIGFLYFTLVALSELTSWDWVYRWQKQPRGREER